MSDLLGKSVKGLILVFIFTILGALLGYGFRLALARNLTVDQYGIFYALYSLFALIYIARDLGTGQAMTKYMPEFITLKKFKKLKFIVIFSLLATTISSAILLLLSAILSKTIAANYLKHPELASYVVVFGIMFFIYALEAMIAFYITGLQLHKSYSIFQLLRTGLIFIFTLIILSFTKSIWSPVWGYISAGIIMLAIYLPYTASKIPNFKKEKVTYDKKLAVNLLRYGGAVILVSVGALVLQYTDSVLITAFKGTEQAGIYNAALPVANLLLYIGTAISVVLGPLISELYTIKNKEAIKSGISLIYKYSFMTVMPMCFIVLAFATQILDIFFGPQYLSGTLPLQILIFGTFFYLFAQTAFGVFTGIGKPYVLAKITGIGAVTNIILNLILIPKYGLVGAAIATAIGYLLMAALCLIWLKKEIGFIVDLKHLIKTTIYSLVIFYGVIYFLNTFLSSMNIYIRSLILIISAGVAYFAVLLLTKHINIKELIQLIKSAGIKK